MEIECRFIATSYSYKCKVTKAAIIKPNVDVVSFKGNHQPGKSNDDVTEIDFLKAKIEYFPRNLPKIFPYLTYLRIENCGLKEISCEDLIGLEKLEWLNLENNQLTSLPDDLFSNMRNLKYVFLGRNKIEFASSKLIEPIVGNKLELFSMTRNTSINEFYWRHSGTIQELMEKIDKNCKPPKPQPIAKPFTSPMIAKPSTSQMIAKPPTTQPIAKPATAKPQCGSNYHNTTERQFLQGFNEFRLLGRFTDFVIVVGSKEFPVNKNVLATQSKVLAGMFEVKTNGRSASKLEISELSAEAVESFLAYLYERQLPDAQNAVEIFKLAAKYEVAKLKIICEGIIQDNLDESNAFEIFKLACGPHKSEKLKVAAFEKLQEKFGGELEDDLVNDPEQLQEIVRTKRHLDELMNESRVKKQRLV